LAAGAWERPLPLRGCAARAPAPRRRSCPPTPCRCSRRPGVGGNGVAQQIHSFNEAHQLVMDHPVELSSGVYTVCVAAGNRAAASAAPCEAGTPRRAATPVHVPARLRAARLGLPYQPMGLAGGGHASREGQGSASEGYSQAAGGHDRTLCITWNARPARVVVKESACPMHRALQPDVLGQQAEIEQGAPWCTHTSTASRAALPLAEGGFSEPHTNATAIFCFRKRAVSRHRTEEPSPQKCYLTSKRPDWPMMRCDCVCQPCIPRT